MMNLVFTVLQKVLAGISPQIREELKNFLAELEKKAQTTSNPLDDIFVLLLRIVAGF